MRALSHYWRDAEGYGTIEPMQDRRVRLTPNDISMICAALRARAAMTKGLKRHAIERLVERLSEGVRGNPKWIHSEYSQTHEDEMDVDDVQDE